MSESDTAAPRNIECRRAVLIYHRPVVRSVVLAEVASLGLMVTEFDPAEARDYTAAEGDVVIAAVPEAIGRRSSTLRPRPDVVLLSSRANGARVHAVVAYEDEPGSLAAAIRTAWPAIAAAQPAKSEWFAYSGRKVQLNRAEASLLELLQASDRPLSLDELTAGAWGDGAVSPGYVKAVLFRTRRKLAAAGAPPHVLRAVRGQGYVLNL